MVAEFNPGKRHRDALEALAIAGRKDLHLAFAGHGLTTHIRDTLSPNSIRWSDYMTDPIEDDRLSKRPESDAVYYAPVPGWMLNASSIRSRESDFIDSIYRDGRTVVYSNEELGVYGDSKLSEKEFIELCKAKVDEASKIGRAHV